MGHAAHNPTLECDISLINVTMFYINHTKPDAYSDIDENGNPFFVLTLFHSFETKS